MSSGFIVVGILALIAIAFLFLILREVTLWYFRIHEAVALLQEIRDRLPSPASAPSQVQPPTSSRLPLASQAQRELADMSR